MPLKHRIRKALTLLAVLYGRGLQTQEEREEKALVQGDFFLRFYFFLFFLL